MANKLDLSEMFSRMGAMIGQLKSGEINALQFILGTVQMVEGYSNEVKAVAGAEAVSGSDKKEIAVKVINDAVDIPGVPEGVEGWLFGFLVDIVVDMFNREGLFKKKADVVDSGTSSEGEDKTEGEGEPAPAE